MGSIFGDYSNYVANFANQCTFSLRRMECSVSDIMPGVPRKACSSEFSIVIQEQCSGSCYFLCRGNTKLPKVPASPFKQW